MPPLHAIQRRYLAEDLTRLRRADEQQRYAASQRRGRIDPNPHQIDAVVFALRRLPEGGCILADEVGLGKTIEAGLVIAQRLAEGTRRVLLIVPKPLLGQWRDELYALFGLAVREGRADPTTLAGVGVFVVSREFAGNDRGAGLLRTSEPFDLVVIDEAHEVFAGIYRRYDKRGDYDPEATEARMAHRVRTVIGPAPVMLLTATPIQNSLLELWGLVQYVEPTGTLLGKLPTFRQVFCDGDDRKLVPAQAHELKRRVATVMKRTLRRQAQEFLERPFVDRRARLFDYDMTPEEKALYDDVTTYLLEPDLCAFAGNQRRLLIIGFHRRMASSLPALAASLENVVARLARLRDGLPETPAEQLGLAFARDLEENPDDDEPEEPSASATGAVPSRARVESELRRVEGFVARARALPGDSKAEALIEAVRVILELGRRGEGSGRAVIFTESLTTQEYLARLLVEEGGLTEDEVTLFRGQNDTPRAQAALARWRAEIETTIPSYNRPTRDVAVRLALVHEFRTRSRVFVSTEAGAKGLNLQFCETIVNYDLPWNPQRIEQRIGRCHRYGQQRGVTVVNFLAKDNEAQRLTFEILSQKLDLFGKVLDASDAVLHESNAGAGDSLPSTVGVGFEDKLKEIYRRSRTIGEVEEELRRLREAVSAERAAFDDVQARTSSLIETRLDDAVRDVFRRYQTELPASLARLDRDLERLVAGYLDALRLPFERREQEGRVLLDIPASGLLPGGLQDGLTVATGHSKGLEDAEPLHLGHPLVTAAVEEARASGAAPARVFLRRRPGQRLTGVLGSRPNARGRLVVTKVGRRGFEPAERLVVTVLLEATDAPLAHDEGTLLLELMATDAPAFTPPITVTPEDVDDAVQAALFADQREASAADQARFERALEQLERYVDDQALVLRRERQELADEVSRLSAKRDTTLSMDGRRKLESELARLEARQEQLGERCERIEAREDPDYVRWRADAHARRYARPEVTRVLDVEFALS
jgi:hypothetical protein